MEQMDVDGQITSTSNQEEAKVEKGNNNGSPIVVILMGAPGSGKSTFCERVMRVSTRPWVRICQDTIGNGKAGTKIKCLMSAATALKEGKNVFIDRCNLDREQRVEFVKLGTTQIEKHIVVLDLPSKLCISRSVKRTDHEGNLQGGVAAAVVNRMLQKKELPKLTEGFTRITICENEKDVESAIDMYSALKPLDTLPQGYFGQKKSDVKVQLGIMKFMKKVDPPAKVEVSKEDQSVKKSEPMELDSSDNTPTLAFPSLSTADFQFNLEKASDIIVEKVKEYVNKLDNCRLVLVDISQNSKILSLVKEKAAQKNVDSRKFFTFVGDITQLNSKGGLRCNVIANAANWRLNPGGGGVNAAIYNAAGPEFESATKERSDSLAPGKALVVPISSTSPLFIKEGVTHVIHVLGPNMNPKRPNCLKDDYVKGCNILGEAYSSLFEGFASIIGTKEVSKDDIIINSSSVNSEQKEQKVKREIPFESERNKKTKGFHNESKNEESKSISKSWGSWAQSLYNMAMNPDKHKNDLLEISESVVVLNDLYPKAQKHVLVVARAKGIDSLADISKENLSLLKTMHDVGLKYAENFSKENRSLIFRIGYHSVPSMRQLHLHVISQDFDSKHLKNKKHWNSFNSPFFRDSVDVMKEVNEIGKAMIKGDDNLLAMELRCHRCRSAHPNIPRLKSHISSCQAEFPLALLQNGCLVSAQLEDNISQ